MLWTFSPTLVVYLLMKFLLLLVPKIALQLPMECWTQEQLVLLARRSTSIQNLISAVLQQDRAAHITIDGKRRPRFRYGSGKWGKALYRVSITSTLTMNAFHAFALPDPEESREPWLTPNMLVPVLLGMEFIKGNGLVIDFNDG